MQAAVIITGLGATGKQFAFQIIGGLDANGFFVVNGSERKQVASFFGHPLHPEIRRRDDSPWIGAPGIGFDYMVVETAFYELVLQHTGLWRPVQGRQIDIPANMTGTINGEPFMMNVQNFLVFMVY